MIIQTINYAGNKRKLLPAINNMIHNEKCNSVIDCFSGSTVVSQFLAYNGLKLWSNDLSHYSYVLSKTLLTHHDKHEIEKYKNTLNVLNNLESTTGWFSVNYGGNADTKFSIGIDGLKKPFQIHNMMKLDAILNHIQNNTFSEKEIYLILTCLLLSLNKLDNTMGHFTSYLKEWSKRSYNNLCLELPILNQFDTNNFNIITQKDCFDLSNNGNFDIAYLDPPYGSSNIKMPVSRVRYNSYYHFWNTLCMMTINDKCDIQLFGKSLRPISTRDSNFYNQFEDYKKDNNGDYISLNSIIALIQKLQTQKFILSYSFGNDKIDTRFLEQLNDCFNVKQIYSQEHKRNVMSNIKKDGIWENKETQGINHEFLILIEK